MKKKTLLITAVFLGLFFNWLFWQKIPGVSFPFFMLAAAIAGYFLLRDEGFTPSKKSFIPILLMVLFSCLVAVWKAPFTTFLNNLMTLFFLFSLIATYRSGDLLKYRFLDYIKNFLGVVAGLFVEPWNYFSIGKKEDAAPQKGWSILRGLLLALPILLVFILLFSSADMVFEQKVEQLFTTIDILELFVRGLVILMVTYLFIGFIQYAALHSAEEDKQPSEKSVIQPFLGYTEGMIVLGSVALLFSTFVLIQFQYFFSGQVNISEAGFTYAEYARRGFMELILVALISLFLIQVLQSVLKVSDQKKQKLFNGLVILQIALVLVILVSSFQRLSLYENAYGFSRLRTFAHVFILWLGILLVAKAAITLLNKQRYFTNICLAVMVAFCLTLNIMNVDAFIVRQNIARVQDGERLDAYYLSQLSTDAVPALAKELQQDIHTDELHTTLGEILKCYQDKIEDPRDIEDGWQSFNLSSWRAEQALVSITSSLDKYECLPEIQWD